MIYLHGFHLLSDNIYLGSKELANVLILFALI
jgi:hypothetical protein